MMVEPRPVAPVPPPRIEQLFRNGSVTVVGIVLGFSLNFLSGWANNPVPWRSLHLLAFVPLLIGTGFQVKALAGFLSLSSLEIGHYNRSKNYFMAGLLLVACGILIAMMLDLVGVGEEFLRR